jgi:hypothetical protein
MEITVRSPSLVLIPAPTPAALAPLFAEAVAHRSVRPGWLGELEAGRLPDPVATLRSVFAIWHAHLQGLLRVVPAVAERLPNPAHRAALLAGVAAAQRPHRGGGEVLPARLIGGICNALRIEAGEDAWARAVAARWREVVLGRLEEGRVAEAVGALALGGEGLAVVLHQRLPAAAQWVRGLPDRVREGVVLLHGADDACRRALRAVAGRLCVGPGVGPALRRGMAQALDRQAEAWQRLHRRIVRSQAA